MLELIVAFDATPDQIDMMKSFWADKKDCPYVISVRQILSDDLVFSLSVFANRPELYMGVYSSITKNIVTDVKLSDESVKNALNELNLKYAHALTRKPPKVNKELALAWIAFINSNPKCLRIPI